MSLLKVNDLDIYYRPIEGGASRRAAEQAAVAALLIEAGLTGPVAHRENGAPYLPAHPDLCLTISHSRRLVALATSTQPIGIDVEEMRSNLPRVLPRVLSAEELAVWADHPLHAWTAKEALYKAALTPGLDFRTQITLTSPSTATVLSTPYKISYATLGPTLLALAHRQL